MRPNPPRGGGGAVWRQPFFWLLGLALLLRLAWVAAKPDFTFADERWYLEIAQSLHAGEGYESPSLRFAVRQAPGQPFFLAAWGGVFPLTPVSAKVANSLVGWLALVLMAWALRRHTGSDSLTTAFCLLAGFHPSLLYTCATNYPQSLQLLSVALVCVLLLRLRGAPTAAATGRLALAAGLAVGAGALCVTTQLFMAPSIPLAAWVGRKNWLLAGVLAVAGVGLAVAPWAVRNAVVEKAFIPLSASGGEMLHLGNNPNTVPNTTSTAAAKDKDPQMKADLLASRSAAEADRVYQAHAKAWMKANPRQALRLWALKTANFFRWDAGKLASGIWWRVGGSNSRPPECHSGALPNSELTPQILRQCGTLYHAPGGVVNPSGEKTFRNAGLTPGGGVAYFARLFVEVGPREIGPETTRIQMEAYAVIETGGKQYRVQKDDVLAVELLDGAEAGQKIKLGRVLALNDGSGPEDRCAGSGGRRR
jgi:hypothetical protein